MRACPQTTPPRLSVPRLGRARVAVWLLCAVTALSAASLSVYMDVRSRSTPDAWGVADKRKVDVFSSAGRTVFYMGPWDIRDNVWPRWHWYPGYPPILHERYPTWWRLGGFGFAVARQGGRTAPQSPPPGAPPGAIQIEVP